MSKGARSLRPKQTKRPRRSISVGISESLPCSSSHCISCFFATLIGQMGQGLAKGLPCTTLALIEERQSGESGTIHRLMQVRCRYNLVFSSIFDGKTQKRKIYSRFWPRDRAIYVCFRLSSPITYLRFTVTNTDSSTILPAIHSPIRLAIMKAGRFVEKWSEQILAAHLFLPPDNFLNKNPTPEL